MNEICLGHAGIDFDGLTHQIFRFAIPRGLEAEKSERVESLELVRVKTQDFCVKTRRFREIARFVHAVRVLQEKFAHRRRIFEWASRGIAKP